MATLLTLLGVAAVLLAAPAAALAAYAPWVAQSSGTTQTLMSVTFVDAGNGWAVGGGGTIRHTTSGGATWTRQASGTTQVLNGVAFVDETNGWAVGGGGVILHTVNGGARWTAQASGTTQTLYAVAFADADTGWAVGARGTVLRTTNGGGKWTVRPSGTRWALYGVTCSASTCWVVGNKGTVRRSTDGGATWTAQAAGTKSALYAIAFTGDSSGWLAGGGGALSTTSNGGATWTRQSTGGGQTLYALTRPDASRGWAAGASGAIRTTANGSSWSIQASGTTQTLRGLAASGSRAWAVGAGGAILTYSPDVKAPVTTTAGLASDGHSDWTNAARTVTLTAVDAGRAGVAATYYTVDGGGQLTYSSPFTVAGAGTHTITYWSADQAGNVEAAGTGYVNIDVTPPTVGHDADGSWHTGDVTVHLTAADAGGSGVAKTEYRPAGAPGWMTATGDAFLVAAGEVGDGAHIYEIRAVDVAGNASGTSTCTVKVDATAPTTTPTGLGVDALSDWGTTERMVSLAADDGLGSGVASRHYTVDGGLATPYTGPFTISGAGQHQVTYWSVDAAGNTEPVRTGWVNIADFYAQSHGLAADQTSGWYNHAADITITSGGIPTSLTVCYQLDGGPVQTVSGEAAFQVSGAGHHAVVFWALQGALESTRQTGYVNIDVTKPVSTLATPVPTRWVRRAVLVTYNANDEASGVSSIFSSVNGQVPVAGAELPFLAPLTHAGDGLFKVLYWSVDKAGNSEAPRSYTVRIDTRRPTTAAPYSASVVRLRIAKLRFVVRDKAPCAGKAAARIVIKNGSNRTVKTIRKTVKTGLTSTASFRCRLRKGSYRFFVYATDPAGNRQVKVTRNRLTVR